MIGITATPVSKPDSPSASLGKTRSDKPITIKMPRGSIPELVVVFQRADCQSATNDGCIAIW